VVKVSSLAYGWYAGSYLGAVRVTG
jgi:hypothetical protein